MIFGYAILFSAHLSVSFSNDYFDIENDKLSRPTLFTGGSGILVQHPELSSFAKKFAIFLILLSLVLAILFIVHYSFNWFFFILILTGSLLGWYYSAPPVRFVSRGLGEVTTMITAGILLPGMGYFILMGGFEQSFLIFLLPLLFYGLAFIISVEIPDLDCDQRGNKMTFVTRFGRNTGFGVIAFLLAISAVYFILISFVIQSIINLMMVAVFSFLPFGIGLAAALKKPSNNFDLATKFATSNVSAYILFVLILDIYLIWLLH